MEIMKCCCSMAIVVYIASDGETPVLRDLVRVLYSFIVITPRFTLTQSANTCYGPIHGSNRSV